MGWHLDPQSLLITGALPQSRPEQTQQKKAKTLDTNLVETNNKQSTDFVYDDNLMSIVNTLPATKIVTSCFNCRHDH